MALRLFQLPRLAGSLRNVPSRFAMSTTSRADPDLKDLLEANKSWVEAKKKVEPTFFDKIGSKQTPKYLWIGCSDSRVPANQILGLSPGEVFVHRNLGNVVPNSDINCQSVIEYAVAHLDVEHIIVAGHFDCGAVKASLETQDLGLIEFWVRNIRDVHRLHIDELEAIKEKKKKTERLIELNVIEQCLNVYKSGAVQRRRLETSRDPDIPFSYPRVHGVVFDPAEGLLRKLPIDLKTEIKQYQHIYDLVHSDPKEEK